MAPEEKESYNNHFTEKFSYISGGSRDGDSCNLYTKKSKSHKEFFYLGAKVWNILPQSLRTSQTVKSFSSAYKNALLENVKNDENYQMNNCFDEFYLISTNSI